MTRSRSTPLEAALLAAAKTIDAEIKNAKRTVDAIKRATPGSHATPRQASLEAGVVILQGIANTIHAAEIAARATAEERADA